MSTLPKILPNDFAVILVLFPDCGVCFVHFVTDKVIIGIPRLVPQRLVTPIKRIDGVGMTF